MKKKGKNFQQNSKISGKKNPKFPNVWVKKMKNLLNFLKNLN
jgi:hypothetical protein